MPKGYMPSRRQPAARAGFALLLVVCITADIRNRDRFIRCTRPGAAQAVSLPWKFA